MTTVVRLIVNPAARHGLTALKEVEQFLEGAGWRVETCVTTTKDHGTILAKEAVLKGCDMVVACGGDGTVNEVANGLAGSDTALGVVPLGTGNAWAREVGLPRKLTDAARVLVEGQVRRMDLGVAGGRYFLLMAGIGLDAEVTRHVPREAKRRWGILAYVLSAVWTGLRFTGTPAVINVDGQVLRRRVLMVVLSNTRLYGGLLGVTLDAVIDDGLLDVCIFSGRGLMRGLVHFVNVLSRRHTSTPDVEYYRCRVLEVSSRQPLPVQIDGDPLASTPMSFRVVPRALSVVLPKKVPANLFSLPALDREHRNQGVSRET